MSRLGFQNTPPPSNTFGLVRPSKHTILLHQQQLGNGEECPHHCKGSSVWGILSSSNRTFACRDKGEVILEGPHPANSESISPTDLPFTIDLEVIQVIDVRDRCLRVFDPKLIKYAPLSYVWGEAGDEHRKLFETLQTKADGGGDISTSLTSRVPGIIEEAMMVCERLSISYLWVDLLCIHQTDSGKKAAEIKAMGYIYHLSHITIVAGSSSPNGAHLAPTTVPTQEKHQLDSRQRIETIGNRQYITSLPSIGGQIPAPAWSDRGWTYQEGQMARRIAFLGDYDISFLCRAGLWRESLHSGEFGHDAERPGLDLHSKQYFALSSYTWLRQKSGVLRIIYQSLETKAIELDGLLLNSGLEGAHRTNKCAQKLARLSVSEVSGILTVESEVARFFIDIKPGPSPLDDDSASEAGWETPPKEGDHVKVPSWEYDGPRDDWLCLRNASGNVYPIVFPAVRYWPTLVLGLPDTLRGSTLAWLLSRGIEMVKIVEIELLEGEDDLEPFHCLVSWHRS
ncbi:hypothetical protein PG988_014357 [Apiospora saccharicola]